MWLKVFAFKLKGKNTSEETGGRNQRILFFGCQRKSVWCASSSRKCIDVRHRHSSPPPAERLTVAHPVCFFCFFLNDSVQETCKVNTANLHPAHMEQEILLFLGFHRKNPKIKHSQQAFDWKNHRFWGRWCGRKLFLLVTSETNVEKVSKIGTIGWEVKVTDLKRIIWQKNRNHWDHFVLAASVRK